MTRERRAADRFARRLDLRYWRRGNSQPLSGFTTNVSASGMFLATTQVMQPGERVRVELLDAKNGAMLEGQVVRVHRVTMALRHVDTPGAGVRFLPPDELVAAIVPAVRPRAVPRPDRREGVERLAATNGAESRTAARSEPPGTVHDSPLATTPEPTDREGGAPSPGEAVVVPVEFSDRSSFLSVYHRDLATGALFVSTEVPAALHQEVVIELITPPPVRRTLRFRAEVVRRFEPEAAVGPGRNLLAGVGLRFRDPERVRAELEPVIAELRRSPSGS
jgi:Tfp pilus assembly protein PilZ